MSDRIGQQLGNYRLVRLLGQGGFAEVYLGEHIYLRTSAAIKVLSGQLTKADIQDFLQEAQRIAALKHRHILRVLDFGMYVSTPFLVLEYAAHGSLRERHRRGTQVALPIVVSYVKQIAQALQYAHDARLIHRDVKPANVLLDDRDTLLLSDFGLATIAHQTASMSINNKVGTAAYMAPEQLQGKPGPASDQYALAVMVYEWLCGQIPYQGDPISIGIQHLTAPIPALSLHNASLSPQVETIVQTALAKAPKQRFATVLDFATALERASQLSHAPTLYTALQSQVQRGTFPRLPAISSTPAPGTSWLSYTGHSGPVYSVAWSPDGTQLASAGSDNTVRVWDARTGNTLLTYTGHSGLVYSVVWSPDGTRLASAGSDGAVDIWDARSGGRPLLSYTGHSKEVRSVVWSPDGTRLASAGSDGAVHIWDARSGGRPLLVYTGHSGLVHTVAWSPNGTRLASGGSDKTVRMWDARTGRFSLCYTGHSKEVRSVVWSPDSAWLASASLDKTVRVWDTRSGDLPFTYTGHSKEVHSIAWSPDGTRLASGSWDKTVQVWDTRTRDLPLTYTGHSKEVHSVVWSPDGTRLASGSWDKTVLVWQG